jgi:hypothetical protein
VESPCKLGNEPSGSIKCWELSNGCTSCGLSSDTQLHRVSLVSYGADVCSLGHRFVSCLFIDVIYASLFLYAQYHAFAYGLVLLFE